MKRGLVAAIVSITLLALSCRQPSEPNSTTIEQAPPRPGALPPEMATLGRTPNVTTTGSPQPWKNIHAAVENIEIGDEKIATRQQLPRMNTEFRITNRGTVPHALVFRGSHDPIQAPTLAPKETVYFSVTITDQHYALSCGLPGHRERGQFETYQPQ